MWEVETLDELSLQQCVKNLMLGVILINALYDETGHVGPRISNIALQDLTRERDKARKHIDMIRNALANASSIANNLRQPPLPADDSTNTKDAAR